MTATAIVLLRVSNRFTAFSPAPMRRLRFVALAYA